MRPRRALPGILLLALALTAVNAQGAGVVGRTQIQAAVHPIDVNDYVHPIDPRDYIHPIDLSQFVQPIAATHTKGSTTTLTLSADILFDFGRANLTDAAHRAVADIAHKLRHSATGRVAVDGYTDDVGTSSYNLRLSQRRAHAVQRALQRAVGRSSGLSFAARGFGESHPVAPNRRHGHDNPRGRARNRRVVITFTRA